MPYVLLAAVLAGGLASRGTLSLSNCTQAEHRHQQSAVSGERGEQGDFTHFVSEAGLRCGSQVRKDCCNLPAATSWNSKSTAVNATDSSMSCDLLESFLRIVSPTCPWMNSTCATCAPPQRKGRPFRVGIFGGSNTAGRVMHRVSWAYIVKKILDALEIPVRVDNNGIAGHGAEFWLNCQPTATYDVAMAEFAINEKSTQNMQSFLRLLASVARYVVLVELFFWDVTAPYAPGPSYSVGELVSRNSMNET